MISRVSRPSLWVETQKSFRLKSGVDSYRLKSGVDSSSVDCQPPASPASLESPGEASRSRSTRRICRSPRLWSRKFAKSRDKTQRSAIRQTRVVTVGFLAGLKEAMKRAMSCDVKVLKVIDRRSSRNETHEAINGAKSVRCVHAHVRDASVLPATAQPLLE